MKQTKGKERGFPYEYYPGELLTAVEARKNRRLFKIPRIDNVC